MEEKNRVNSIDLLRGIIMIVMALDHTRDYFNAAAMEFDPTDITQTTPALFFTRWITHFCAPAFAFLSGISININLRKRGRAGLVIYLLTRGFWLIFLDLVVLRFAMMFNFYYDLTFLSILWMLGWCMIIMAAMIFLPYRAILAISLLIIVGHDALAGISFEAGSPMASLWTILMSRGFVPPAFISSYPLIPWAAVMMFGFVAGRLYGDKYDPVLRRRLLIQLGLLAIVLFIVLRWVNVYGDPVPWVHSDRGTVYTILSYFNVSKYAVSLLFILMTLGPLMLLLATLEKVNTNWMSPAVVFGRVPLFYFLVHFYLIHAAALIMHMIRNGTSLAEIDFHAEKGLGGINAQGGVNLFWTYVAWVVIVVVLYPLCKWYDRHKLTYL
ncbi:MAG: heparan-alpha-glucosaminide N-acetyltransferase domain-containing protein [Bacteroidota bacterium]